VAGPDCGLEPGYPKPGGFWAILFSTMQHRQKKVFFQMFPVYKLASPRRAFFLASIGRAKMTPRSRKSGYGLLLGCRSGLDGGPSEKLFLTMFEKKN
jgi:hypothetical protein